MMLSVLLLAGTPAAAQDGQRPPPVLSDGRAAAAFLKRSAMPLKDWGGDCPLLAQRYATLGALVKSHLKRANVEKTVRCARSDGVWSCQASFVYNDAKKSEKDWGLKLKLKVDEKSGKISDLECHLAG